MGEKVLAIIIASLTLGNLSAISQTIALSFTAVDSISYVKLDSIKIINKTQDVDTMLYWPDTVLILNYLVGVEEQNDNQTGIILEQNYPNPVNNATIVPLTMPEPGNLNMVLSSMTGGTVLEKDFNLDKGRHIFSLIPGNSKIYILSVKWNNNVESIKILNRNTEFTKPKLSYIGTKGNILKGSEIVPYDIFQYTPGDQLQYIGYNKSLESGIPDKPLENEIYVFQFGYGFPCIGTPTVIYEGQEYNSVQIFSQCWFKENLNVGLMVPGGLVMEDNGLIEKYCYGDVLELCETYGGFYQWDELMNYSNEEEGQGICPSGWHIPNDIEWKVLSGVVDSQYGVGDLVWDSLGISGYDVALNLRSDTAWLSGGNGPDLYGFSAIPGGMWLDGEWMGLGSMTRIWSSSVYILNYRLYRGIRSSNADIFYNFHYKGEGFSARCIKD